MTEMFYVVGGIYENPITLKNLYEAPELHGPFNTYDEAYKVWRARIWWNIDNYQHRVVIVKNPMVKYTSGMQMPLDTALKIYKRGSEEVQFISTSEK